MDGLLVGVDKDILLSERNAPSRQADELEGIVELARLSR